MNATVSQAPMAIQPPAGFRKFTVEQYHQLIRTGVLFEGGSDRVTRRVFGQQNATEPGPF